MNEQTEFMTESAALVRFVAQHPSAGRPHHELNQAVTILGSGEGCDLILASGKVDASHAAVVRLGGGAYLCDLGAPGGTSLNGRRVRWARLATGDQVTIGPFHYQVEAEDAVMAAAVHEPAFSLRSEQAGGVVASIDPVMIVGSDPGCDVVLQRNGIAPRHCLVVWTHEGPVVRDLQRRSNTRLNGRRINLEHLASGDAIGVGPAELIFLTDDDGNEEGDTAGEEHRRDAGATILNQHRSEEDRSEEERLEEERLEEDRSEEDGTPTLSIEALDISELVAGRLALGRASEWDILWPETGSSTVDGGDDKAVTAVQVEPVQEPRPLEASAAAPEKTPDRPPPPSPKAAVVRTEKERQGRLDQRVRDLRERVAAAQNALDARARKHRETLDRERKHLTSMRGQLQQQAEKLLKYARRKQRLAAEGRISREMQMAVAGPEETPPIEESSADRDDDRPTESTGPAGEPDRESVRLTAEELTGLVRDERGAIERAAARFETLASDINRLRMGVTQAREKHQARDGEIDERFRALEKTQRELHRERDELMAGVRRLDTEDTDLEARIKEAEQCREGFEKDAVSLREAATKLQQYQRDLEKGLEEEQRRARARQRELQRKTLELAQATRNKRCSIEIEVSRSQSELDRQQRELQARRANIETAGRRALEKTAAELEEVLSVGLSEIEIDVTARQANRDVTSQEGSTPDRAVADAEQPSSSGDRVAAAGQDRHEQGRSVPPRDTVSSAVAAAHLETLAGEVEAIRGSLAKMEPGQHGSMASCEHPAGESREDERRSQSGAAATPLDEGEGSSRGQRPGPGPNTPTYDLRPTPNLEGKGQMGSKMRSKDA